MGFYRLTIYVGWQIILGIYYDPCDKVIGIDLPLITFEISLRRFTRGIDFVNNFKSF